jgi:hypothetical protein
MTQPATRARACDGKRRHRTRGAARAAVRNLTARGARRIAEYRCPHCGAYHIGHLPYDAAEETHRDRRR